MRFPIPALLLALVLVACSTETATTSSLVVLDTGNVAVIDPDGSNRISITEGAEDVFFQPVWSLDGSMIAFAQRTVDVKLHVALADGSARYSVDVETSPFYYSWSAKDEVALLRNGESGLQLELTSLSDDELSEPTLLDSGAPLYYSWSPDGSELATHIGQDRLDSNVGGSTESLGIEPGSFQAPSWTDDGVLAIEQGLRDQRLTLLTPDGESTALATLPGPATFVATHDGARVAIQSIVAGLNGLSASFQTLPNISANRLIVGDLEEGVFTAVTDEPVLAYFWAPTGDRLLILDLVEGPQTRWRIWTEDGLEEIVRFDPEPSFMAEMVPFFDQYAQSVSLWAADGSAFAFPGSVDDEPGIWVYNVDGSLDRVSGGTWVSWSP